MSAMASQITNLTIVYSIVYSGADQRKKQSSASLAFVRGIHRWPVNSPHKVPVTRKCFHLMTSSWTTFSNSGIFFWENIFTKITPRPRICSHLNLSLFVPSFEDFQYLEYWRVEIICFQWVFSIKYARARPRRRNNAPGIQTTIRDQVSDCINDNPEYMASLKLVIVLIIAEIRINSIRILTIPHCYGVNKSTRYTCDDGMTWKCLPHYWSFVRGIHWSPVQRASNMDLLMVSFFIMKKLFNKQFSCQWFGTFIWRHWKRLFGVNNLNFTVETAGLMLGLLPANERRRYFVTTSLIGWAKSYNQPWKGYNAVAHIQHGKYKERTLAACIVGSRNNTLQYNTILHIVR